MTDYSIKTLSIYRYKSIRQLDHLSLDNLNVLIGANGAGKSNFVSFFTFMSELINCRLQSHIAELGGAKRILSVDCHPSECFATIIGFKKGALIFIAGPTEDDRLQLLYEKYVPVPNNPDEILKQLIVQYQQHRIGELESRLWNLTASEGLISSVEEQTLKAISNWRVYHFHDSSQNAGFRRYSALNDHLILQSDASNIAAVLYRLQQEAKEYYDFICATVMLVVPYFEDFVLMPREMPGSTEPQILLKWRQRGVSDVYNASQLSDGTIRFICLAVALLQPNLPETMLFDEPELGLHPSAVELLASMLQMTSDKSQVLVSTQSPALLNHFEPEDVLVVEQEQGNSVFRRLDRKGIGSWLDEYSLAQLWEKNILGGRPR